MAAARSMKGSQATPDQLRDDWLARLQELIAKVKRWGEELDWATRLIEKRMRDSEIGSYTAPALILQKETCRILLEPISHSAPGAEGVVDLYLMPAYDEIASLYYRSGKWWLHYMFAGGPTAATVEDAQSKPLSRETLRSVLEEMRANAA